MAKKKNYTAAMMNELMEKADELRDMAREAAKAIEHCTTEDMPNADQMSQTLVAVARSILSLSSHLFIQRDIQSMRKERGAMSEELAKLEK